MLLGGMQLGPAPLPPSTPSSSPGLSTAEANLVRDKLNAIALAQAPGAKQPPSSASPAPLARPNTNGILLRPPPVFSPATGTPGSGTTSRRLSPIEVPHSGRSVRRSFGHGASRPGTAGPVGGTATAAATPAAGVTPSVGVFTPSTPIIPVVSHSGTAPRFRSNKSGLELLEREVQVGRSAKDAKKVIVPRFDLTSVNAFQMATPEMRDAIASDAHLKRMCAKLKLEMPENLVWQRTMCKLLDQLPVAALLVNMKLPGLPITHATPLASELTGYAVDEMIGRNCRFLQGKHTEGSSVLTIINAVRNAQPATVRIINYKKSGEEFELMLALHPVHDSHGEYRYCIGLQCEPTKPGTDMKLFQKVLGLLPTKFDAVTQPLPFGLSLRNVDLKAQQAQWADALKQLTPMLWSVNWTQSFRTLKSSPSAMAAFSAFLQSTAPQEAKMLDLCLNIARVQPMPRDQQYAPLHQAFRDYFGQEPADPDALRVLGILEQEEKLVEPVLAYQSLPRFAADPASLPVIREITAPLAGSIKKADGYLWTDYSVPADMAGWLHAFVNVALAYPMPIVLSDMNAAGNSLCFVNDAFCRATGYDRREVTGRNCRFLQGSRTEQASVAVIQDTIRRGVDCHVKITNYRKNGEVFVNLLSLRPVHDSNSVYRYSIGVQFEIEANDKNLKENIAKIDRIMGMLPKMVSVASKPVGLEHRVEATADEAAMSTEDKLLSALAGSAQVPTGDRLHEAGYYDSNYEEHIKHCSVMSGFRVDPQLQSFAKANKLKPPKAGPWLVRFSELADQIPLPVLLVDVQVPGLPLAYVNSAACALSGYTYDEMVGRNCRFLQGSRTKGAAVRQITAAIRRATAAEVQILNVRQDGSEIELILGLHPVFDDTGAFRFMIGLQCSLTGGKTIPPTDRKLFNKIKSTLPERFESVLQVSKYSTTLTEVSDAEQLKQWGRTLEMVTRLAWSDDVYETIEAMFNTPSAITAFTEFLKKHSPEDALKLEMCAMTLQLASLPPDQQSAAAMQICAKYEGITPLNAEAAMAHLQNSVKRAAHELADGPLVDFLQAKECRPLLHELIGDSSSKIHKVDDYVWRHYTAPEDMRGFFYGFVQYANNYPFGMCLTEMTRSGNPLCYVNPAFLTMTGYDKVEVLGSNCRFLQGQATEPWSVAVMIDAIRRGVDCHVKITNYRKNGTSFPQLLTIRPVHDSNSVYRYCIGILYELESGSATSTIVDKIDRLLRILPDTVQVASAPVGPKHEVKYADEELEQTTEDKISAALEGSTKVYTKEIIEDSDYFTHNYTQHLQYINGDLSAQLNKEANEQAFFEPTPPSVAPSARSPSRRFGSFRG